MSSKHPPGRVLGQKSIASTFLFRSWNQKQQESHRKEDVKISTSGKGSRVSLSDFLNKKLHKSSVLPHSVQVKERPFSLVGTREVDGSNHELNGPKKRGETEVKTVVDVVFEQFKCTAKEKEGVLISCDDDEFGRSGIDAVEKGRKRKSPFGGEDREQSAQKNIVVLGEGGHPNPIRPTPTLKGKEQSSIPTKKPRHQFNHYANGGGWWNCDMAGVDNEEVGSSEVWEGIGSTTLGGLDWN